MLRSQAARIVCRFLTGLVLIAATTGPANAQGRGHPEGWGGGPLLGVPLRALSLTPDQQAQAMTLLSTARTTARPIVQQLHQALAEGHADVRKGDVGVGRGTAGPGIDHHPVESSPAARLTKPSITAWALCRAKAFGR